MKFRNKQTGAILEPRAEVVEARLRADDLYEEYQEGTGAAGGGNAGNTGEKALEKMNKTELLALAAELQIEVPDKATNDAIRELIKAKREADGQ